MEDNKRHVKINNKDGRATLIDLFKDHENEDIEREWRILGL